MQWIREALEGARSNLWTSSLILSLLSFTAWAARYTDIIHAKGVFLQEKLIYLLSVLTEFLRFELQLIWGETEYDLTHDLRGERTRERQIHTD